MGLSDLQAITDGASSKSLTSRNKNKAKGNPTSWRLTWMDALREFYPENVLDYPDRVSNNLKQAIAKRGLPYDDMANFLHWIVANWQQLRKQVFSYSLKTPKGPETPDLSFVIPNLVQVHAKYMQSKPEIAAAMPLGKRLTGTVLAATATAPKLTPKPLPAAPLAPLNRVLIPAYKSDPAKAEASRQRLGLPKWED